MCGEAKSRLTVLKLNRLDFKLSIKHFKAINHNAVLGIAHDKQKHCKAEGIKFY